MTAERPYKEDTKSSFLALYVRHQKSLYNFILSLCPNYIQADDILQETAIVMWDKFGELENPDNFLAWAVQIARYKILNHRKKKTAGLWLNEDVLERINSETQKSLKNSSRRTEALQECLLKLSIDERKLIALRYEQGKSFAEIAKKVNRSINGLYNTSAKIHVKLRLCISHVLKQWEPS
jgi:RNA polymerase sigma-70 factor (ECF subfamily)